MILAKEKVYIYVCVCGSQVDKKKYQKNTTKIFIKNIGTFFTYMNEAYLVQEKN